MSQAHGQMLGHLVRRGVELLQSEPALPAMSMSMDRDDKMMSDQDQWNRIAHQIPPWSLLLIGATMLVFYLIMISLSYTIGRVVMTLAMIETPTVDYIPVSALENIDDGSKADLLIDGEPHIMEKNKPITSKIRGTLRHLTAHAGWTARWRGLGYAIIYVMANGFVHGVANLFLFWLPGGAILAAVAAAVVTAQLHCAWTHKMISVSSAKSFRSRIPSMRVWRQLWIPNAVASATGQVSMILIGLLIAVFARGAIDSGNNSDQPPKFADSMFVVIAKVIAVLTLAFFLLFFVVLPNYAALTRIEATLLPDEEDTIVPFDRTFGGKVTPVVVGGSGLNYVKEVCRTFDSEARGRIMKLFFKGALIATAVIIVFVHVLSFEVFLVIGPLAKKAAKDAGARMMARI